MALKFHFWTQKVCPRCGKTFEPTASQLRDGRRAPPCWACDNDMRVERGQRKPRRAMTARRMDGSPPDLAQALQNYIPVPEAGCWLWLGHITAFGYGRIPMGKRGHFLPAHRASLEMAKGPIPEGMFACHKCDTPSCINPDHLYVGTPADNTRDMWQRGRARPYGRKQRKEIHK